MLPRQVPVYSQRSLRYQSLEKLKPCAWAQMDHEVVEQLEGPTNPPSQLFLMFGQRGEVLVHKQFLRELFPLLRETSTRWQYTQLAPLLTGGFPFGHSRPPVFRDGNPLNLVRANVRSEVAP